MAETTPLKDALDNRGWPPEVDGTQTIDTLRDALNSYVATVTPVAPDAASGTDWAQVSLAGEEGDPLPDGYAAALAADAGGRATITTAGLVQTTNIALASGASYGAIAIATRLSDGASQMIPLLLAVTGTPTPTPTPTPVLQPVGARNYVAWAGVATSMVEMQNRKFDRNNSNVAFDQITLYVPSVYIDSGFADAQMGTDMTVSACIQVNGGTAVQFSKGGSFNLVIPASTAVSAIDSMAFDPLTITINPGDYYHITKYIRVATAGFLRRTVSTMRFGPFTGPVTGDRWEYSNTVGGLTNRTVTANWGSEQGGFNDYWMPDILVGRTVGAVVGNALLCAPCDSYVAGANEDAGSTTSDGNGRQGAFARYFGKTHGILNLARSGSGLDSWNDDSKTLFRTAMSSGMSFTDLLVEAATNSIQGNTSPNTYATLKPIAEAQIVKWKNRTVNKNPLVWIPDLPAQTTSTDSYATVANQTLRTRTNTTNPEPERLAWNAAAAAKSFVGQDRYFRFAQYLMVDNAGSRAWYANGTTDGTHGKQGDDTNGYQAAAISQAG